MGADGDLIGHGPGGQEQSGLCAENASGFLLEGSNGWIIPKHVVTDGGIRHGEAHGFGGLSDGIASQVDDLHSAVGASFTEVERRG